MFICLEGGDAVGKATQSRLIAGKLAEILPGRTQHLSFPRYKTAVGEAILRHLKEETILHERDASKVCHPHEPRRSTDLEPGWRRASEDPLVFQCMMVADKVHAGAQIARLLHRKDHVVSDRWWQSAFVYGTSDGLDPVWLEEVHQLLPGCHLNILLDLDPSLSAMRRPDFRDRYERDRGKMKDVRERYLKLWSGKPAPGEAMNAWLVIDAARPKDSVYASVLAAVLLQWKSFFAPRVAPEI